MTKRLPRYYMVLVAFGDPDHGQSPESVIAPIEEHRCNTLKECREALYRWTAKNNIDSVNYPESGVWDTRTQRCIGKLLFDGTFNRKSKEIEII